MNETTQITYGEGTITVTMSSESVTEVAATDVRFGSYNGALTACFTAKELEEIAAGSDAEVTFDFIMRDELEDPDEEQIFDRAIEKAQKSHGSFHKGVFFDVVATKSIGGEEPEEFHNFYNDVEVQFEIPLYLVADERYYYIMTNEMGVCSLEQDVDEDADTLSVSTRSIGTTLLLYQGEYESLVQKDTTLHIESHHLFLGGIILLALAWLGIDFRHRRG